VLLRFEQKKKMRVIAMPGYGLFPRASGRVSDAAVSDRA
jgi:hypothetical protein